MCSSASSRALRVGVGDDDVAGQGPLGDGLRASRGPPMLQKRPLPIEQARQIRRRSGNPVVAEEGGALQGEGAPSADPQWGMGLGQGFGLQAPFDRVVRAPKAHAFLGPEPLHDGQLLLEACSALREVDPVEGELVGLVADGDAQDGPSVRHHVQHGHVLGQAHGMVEGGDHDVRSQQHARGAGGEARQDGERGGPVVVGDGVMLLHPYRIEPQLLGSRDFLQCLSVVVTALDGDEPDLQLGHSRGDYHADRRRRRVRLTATRVSEYLDTLYPGVLASLSRGTVAPFAGEEGNPCKESG